MRVKLCNGVCLCHWQSFRNQWMCKLLLDWGCNITHIFLNGVQGITFYFTKKKIYKITRNTSENRKRQYSRCPCYKSVAQAFTTCIHQYTCMYLTQLYSFISNFGKSKFGFSKHFSSNAEVLFINKTLNPIESKFEDFMIWQSTVP